MYLTFTIYMLCFYSRHLYCHSKESAAKLKYLFKRAPIFTVMIQEFQTLLLYTLKYFVSENGNV